MSMAGKRVKVFKIHDINMSEAFEATLTVFNSDKYYKLDQTSIKGYRGQKILQENQVDFGKDKTDYYELVSDEINDQVNSPSHYTQGKYEVIDMLEQLASSYKNPTIAYLVSTAGKYLFRAPFKNNLKQDLEKAVWYLNRAIEKL